MSSFNEAQRKAINHFKGPCMVLAGPGSGKTTVITERAKMLINQYKISPSNILVITFTKAAANEMKERFYKLVGTSLPVTFGTFHAVFFYFLKCAYNYQSTNVLSEEDKKQIIKELVGKYKLEMDDEEDFVQGIISEISMIKGDMIDINNYYSTSCAEDLFRKMYMDYEQNLVSRDKIDFDDMLVYCYELFKERKDILSMWQKKYQYILIDEFQDINRIQYEIIKMLALPNNNLFVVGDDDQSIYRFRGAKPEIMLGFDRDYPDSKQIILNINYRSSDDIVEAAKRVIINNSARFSKDIVSYGKKDTPVYVKAMESQEKENIDIVNKIIDYSKTGIPYSEMAVIYRTNTQPRMLVEKLMEYNIPFKMRDKIPNLYEHWIAKNIRTYLEVARGDNDRGKILTIINRPKRYISRNFLDMERVSFDELRTNAGDKGWLVEKINQFEDDLNMISSMQPYAAINYIRKGIGYDEYIIEYAKFRKMKPDELIDILDELQNAAKDYADYEQWLKHIEEYSENILDMATKNRFESDCVTLSTMHSAKGLEFSCVFIIDANEGITPHKKSVKDVEIEEERRMFYVAVTRAKRYLHIYTIGELYSKKLDTSRFVNELLFDDSILIQGNRVVHEKYGEGIVTFADKEKVTIFFEKISISKQFSKKVMLANQIIKKC